MRASVKLSGNAYWSARPAKKTIASTAKIANDPARASEITLNHSAKVGSASIHNPQRRRGAGTRPWNPGNALGKPQDYGPGRVWGGEGIPAEGRQSRLRDARKVPRASFAFLIRIKFGRFRRASAASPFDGVHAPA
jgi:hypothetical protein